MTQTEGLPILFAWLLFLAWLGVLAAIILRGRDKTHQPDTDRSPQPPPTGSRREQRPR